MNLSVIWGELDSADRMVIRSVLYHSEHEEAINKEHLNNDGKLAFLDIHVVLRELQRYLVADMRRHGHEYQRVKKMVGLIIYTLDWSNESR